MVDAKKDFFCLLIGLSYLMLRYVLRSQLSNSLFFRLFTFSIHASHVQTYVTHLEGCMESQTYVRQRQVGRLRAWLMVCINFLSETDRLSA